MRRLLTPVGTPIGTQTLQLPIAVEHDDFDVDLDRLEVSIRHNLDATGQVRLRKNERQRKVIRPPGAGRLGR